MSDIAKVEEGVYRCSKAGLLVFPLPRGPSQHTSSQSLVPFPDYSLCYSRSRAEPLAVQQEGLLCLPCHILGFSLFLFAPGILTVHYHLPSTKHGNGGVCWVRVYYRGLSDLDCLGDCGRQEQITFS